jgi:hypothetical protein
LVNEDVPKIMLWKVRLFDPESKKWVLIELGKVLTIPALIELVNSYGGTEEEKMRRLNRVLDYIFGLQFKGSQVTGSNTT